MLFKYLAVNGIYFAYVITYEVVVNFLFFIHMRELLK